MFSAHFCPLFLFAWWSLCARSWGSVGWGGVGDIFEIIHTFSMTSSIVARDLIIGGWPLEPGRVFLAVAVGTARWGEHICWPHCCFVISPGSGCGSDIWSSPTLSLSKSGRTSGLCSFLDPRGTDGSPQSSFTTKLSGLFPFPAFNAPHVHNNTCTLTLCQQWRKHIINGSYGNNFFFFFTFLCFTLVAHSKRMRCFSIFLIYECDSVYVTTHSFVLFLWLLSSSIINRTAVQPREAVIQSLQGFTQESYRFQDKCPGSVTGVEGSDGWLSASELIMSVRCFLYFPVCCFFFSLFSVCYCLSANRSIRCQTCTVTYILTIL